MTLKLPACLLAAGLALSLAAPPASAAEFTLRFGSINAAGATGYDGVLKPFAEAVARDSAGRIEIDLKPLGGFGKPADMFNMVERGDIEITETVQGYNPGRFPQSSVMELPLMYDSGITGSRAMMALFKEGQFDKDYASVKVLALYVLPPYGIFTTGRKPAQIKDLRGLRVRTPSPTVGLALSRMGMIPLGIPVNLIGDGIANGMVDAITFGWDSLTTSQGAGANKLKDQVSVLVDANFAAPALMIVMNKAKWNALPPDLQAVIDRDAAPLSGLDAQLRETSEATARDRLKADPHYSYVALTSAQHAEMEKLIAPAVADWKQVMARQGLDGERLYARARELVLQSSTAAR